MKIHIAGREPIDVGGTEVELEGCYCGVGIKTDQGLFGVAQRDGGVEVMLDGKLVWISTSQTESVVLQVDALRKALDKSTQLASRMSNICWSLGHNDREVGDREPLVNLAKEWDAFRSGIGDLLKAERDALREALAWPPRLPSTHELPEGGTSPHSDRYNALFRRGVELLNMPSGVAHDYACRRLSQESVDAPLESTEVTEASGLATKEEENNRG